MIEFNFYTLSKVSGECFYSTFTNMFLTPVKYLILVLGCFACFSASAQNPNWVWAQQVGGTGRDVGIITSSDNAGNVYEIGSFTGTLQLGTTTLTSVRQDMYVVKYNQQGTVLWARQGQVQNSPNGPGYAEGISATTDAAGNIYVSGNFSGTITLGAITLTALNGLSNVFVVKFDAQGAARWGLANNGGSNRTSATGLAVNASGDVYVSGSFFGVSTFGGFSVVSQGDSDIFLLKINSLGAVQWIESAGGPGRDYTGALATGPNNGVYVSGGVSATATIGALSVVSQGGTDALLAFYDAQGVPQWARVYGGTGEEGAGPIALAANGELYTTGYFQNTAAFGSSTLTSRGGYDAFVLKCTSQGIPLWVNPIGGSGSDSAFGAIVGQNGELYVSGTFNGTATFGNQSRISAGAADVYVARYTPSGAVVWVTQCGGPGNDYDAGLAYAGSGAVYVGGQFTGTAQFAPFSLTSRGQEDGFVARLQDNTATSSHTGAAVNYGLYPNPVVGTSFTFTLPAQSQGAFTIDLLDAVGRVVRHLEMDNRQLQEQRVYIDTRELAPGNYVLKFTNFKEAITKYFVVR